MRKVDIEKLLGAAENGRSFVENHIHKNGSSLELIEAIKYFEIIEKFTERELKKHS